MTRAILTEEEAKEAAPASKAVATQIVEEGLARHRDDVIVDRGMVFARAYLPDGQKAAFFLKVGEITA